MKFIKFMICSATCLLLFVACSKPQFSELETKPLNDANNGASEVITEAPPELKPPTIVFVQFPNGPVITGEDTTIVYNVLPGSAPLVSIDCRVDGVVVPCSIDGDTLTIKNPDPANHAVNIIVMDANNLQDNDTIEWQAFDRFQKVKMPLLIADEEDQVDILIVIDNSVSMKNEQSNMAEKISNLLDRVKGLDWRVAIVTTDMKDSKLGDGRLLQFPNGDFYLTSKLSLSTAKEQFGKTIQRKESGHFEEQGIKATYRAIQRAVLPKETNDKHNKSFFRKLAALSVIVVSDENETGSASDNTAAGLGALISSAFGLDKMFKFHSIIVRPGDKTCLNSSPNVHREGVAYAALTKITDGVLGDICAKDYGNQLTVIGQDVATTQNTFQLTCAPMDINNDGKQDITVLSSVSSAVPSFTIDNDKIIFSSAPIAGKYSVDYYCPK